VAIKVIILDQYEKASRSIDDIGKEIQMMSTCNHPNILNYYSSFSTGKELWIILPIFEAGSLDSLKNINQSIFKDGCKDEIMLASIFK
jgi:serine/threonine-protein kinase OSR1/STK39